MRCRGVSFCVGSCTAQGLQRRSIDEVFTVVALAPRGRRHIVIAPIDFRTEAGTEGLPDEPVLYAKLRAELARFPQ